MANHGAYVWLFILLCYLLTACGGTWRVPDDVYADDKAVYIQKHPDRYSPRIKSVWHLQLGAYRGDGNIDNAIASADELATRPGLVRLGTVAKETWEYRYMREIEFEAQAAGRYYLTWACIPYPYIFLLRQGTDEIVASDQYCPECTRFIGNRMPAENVCHGAGFSGPEPKFLSGPGFSTNTLMAWWAESRKKLLWDVCAAAEAGVPGARLWLADMYYMGNPAFANPRPDPVLAYIWSQPGYGEGELKIMSRLYGGVVVTSASSLTADQLRVAKQMMVDWQPGQCARELLGDWRPGYEVDMHPGGFDK